MILTLKGLGRLGSLYLRTNIPATAVPKGQPFHEAEELRMVKRLSTKQKADGDTGRHDDTRDRGFVANPNGCEKLGKVSSSIEPCKELSGRGQDGSVETAKAGEDDRDRDYDSKLS